MIKNNYVIKIKIILTSQDGYEDNKSGYAKPWKQCLAHSKCSVRDCGYYIIVSWKL